MNDHKREDRIDTLLDAALAQYGGSEPLHGMEERVLARLRQPAPQRAWWMWGAAAAAAMAIIAGIVVMTRPAEQKATPVVAQQQAQPPATMPRQSAPPASAPQHARSVATHAASVQAATAEKLPRLDVFPTPEPPSQQELLLVRYVRGTPPAEVLAQINRKPLEFHEDPLSAPSTNAVPQKDDATK